MGVINGYYEENLLQDVAPGQTASIVRSTGSAELDKNAFLNILITQLANQDPLNPMDDKETVAQLAQFSALEQMQNVSESTIQSRGAALVGKTVAATMLGSAKEFVGVVDSVRYAEGKTYVCIGDKVIGIENINEVFAQTPESADKPENGDKSEDVSKPEESSKTENESA